ncbi:MAG: hypothetical protein JW908_06200 [Anaerolineales bacterium]|nr:hypothetical protein [Anaerolineales bacterium]
MNKLTYETYLTGNANPTDELPMIVLLHFMGSTPDQIFELLLKDFDRSSRVIAPFGQYKFEEQFSWLPESIYDRNEKDQGSFIDEITGLLLKNVESWKQEFLTRGAPIYLGVSQGGDICFTLAARYGDRFRLCLPVAGRLLVENINKNDHAGIIRIHHGEMDPIVPIAKAREATNHLLFAGFNVELREHHGIGHAVPPEVRNAIFDDIYEAIKE